MALDPQQSSGVQMNVRNPTPAEIAALQNQTAVPPQSPPPGPPPPRISTPPGLGTLRLREPNVEDVAIARSRDLMNPPADPSAKVGATIDTLDAPPGFDLSKIVGAMNPTVSPEGAKRFLRTVVPAAASTVGGIRGGVAGSVVGSGAGEVVSMALESLVGAPPELDEVQTRIASGLTAGAVGEGIGQGIIRGGRRLLAPFARKVTDAGREAVEFLGGHITPAQVTESRGLAVAENILEGSFFGGGRYSQFLKQQNDLLRERADEILDQFGPRVTNEQAGGTLRNALSGPATLAEAQAARHQGSARAAADAAVVNRQGLQSQVGPTIPTEQAGAAWQSLQEAAHDAARSSASALYDEIDRAAGGITLGLEPLLSVAATQKRRVPEMARAMQGKTGQLPGLVERTGTEVVEGSDPVFEGAIRRQVESGDMTGVQALIGADAMTQNTPEGALMLAFQRAGITPEQIQARQVTFSQAHRIRSEFGKLQREAERRGDGQLKYYAGQYFAAIDEEMTAAAGGQGTPLRKAYDQANAAWKTMVRTYEDGLLAEVADKEPRLVVDALVRPGRVADIQLAKKAVGKEAWRLVQAAHLDSILRDNTGNWVTGKELAKRIQTLTPETLDAVYERSGSGHLMDLVANLDEQAAFSGRASELSKEAGDLRARLAPAHRMVADAIEAGKIEEVAKLRKLVGVEDWKEVQSAFGQKLLKGKSPTDLVSGKELMTRLQRLTPETVAEVFPRGTDDAFWQLARVLKQVESRQRFGGAGRTAIQLTQGGIIFGALTGGVKPAAAAILITPPMVVRAMLTPLGRQYLTTGFKAPAGSPTAARAASNLLAFFVREGFLSQAPEGGVRQAPGTTPGSSGRGMGPGPNTGQGGPPPTIGPPPPGPPPQGPIRSGGPGAPATLEALGVLPSGTTSAVLQGPPGPPAPSRAGGPPPRPPGR